MLNGESKRGWTTWTTAAVDKRVFAAIPMTMDLCNLNTVKIDTQFMYTNNRLNMY